MASSFSGTLNADTLAIFSNVDTNRFHWLKLFFLVTTAVYNWFGLVQGNFCRRFVSAVVLMILVFAFLFMGCKHIHRATHPPSLARFDGFHECTHMRGWKFVSPDLKTRPGGVENPTETALLPDVSGQHSFSKPWQFHRKNNDFKVEDVVGIRGGHRSWWEIGWCAIPSSLAPEHTQHRLLFFESVA